MPTTKAAEKKEAPTRLNVYQRLARVIEESGAMPKTGKATAGGRYSFHQIDEVVDHLRPLLLKHGVIPLPSVLEAATREIPTVRADGRQALDHYASCHVAFEWVCTDDPTDRTPPLVSFGEGLDVSDKASGKAVSYAAKAHLLLLFQLRGQVDNETAVGGHAGAEQGYRPPQPQQGNQPPPSGYWEPQAWAGSPQGPPQRHASGQVSGRERVPDPQWAGALPQDTGTRPVDDLTMRVRTLMAQGNPRGAWEAIGAEAVDVRKKFGANTFLVKPQQIKVFYGKCHGAGSDAITMKDLVYRYCGIDASRPMADGGDHLSLVPATVASAVFEVIERGGVTHFDVS